MLATQYKSIYKVEKGSEKRELALYLLKNVPNFTSVENITDMLLAALVMQLSAGANTDAILSIWRENSSELPIKENMTNVLNLIDRMLSVDQNYALKVMKTEDVKSEERVTAALKVVHNVETSLVLSQVLFDGIKKSGIGVPSYNTKDSVGAISASRPTIVC